MKKNAFTLVELAVVLLIIGILAGVILRNIGSQPIQARDTKRIAVLRNIGIYLTQYFSKNGSYPDGSFSQANESEFVNLLTGAGILPPGSTALGFPQPTTWSYTSCSDGTYSSNHFIFSVNLEQSKTAAPELYRDSYQGTVPTGWTCNTTPSCGSSNVYCLLQ